MTERTHSGFVAIGLTTEPVVSCWWSEKQVFLRVGHADAMLGIAKQRPILRFERAIPPQEAQNRRSAGTGAGVLWLREDADENRRIIASV
jgi:hypothetical protein